MEYAHIIKETLKRHCRGLCQGRGTSCIGAAKSKTMLPCRPLVECHRIAWSSARRV